MLLYYLKKIKNKTIAFVFLATFRLFLIISPSCTCGVPSTSVRIHPLSLLLASGERRAEGGRGGEEWRGEERQPKCLNLYSKILMSCFSLEI